MCSCDGLGADPERPSLESGLYVPRVTDWNLKMTPNQMKSKMLKKPVFRICLVGTYGVAQRSKLSNYPDYWSDGGTDLQANSDSRNFCRNNPICPEFLKEILKTLTQKATYYTLSVTSWTRRRPQPLSQRGRRWWLWQTCTP